MSQNNLKIACSQRSYNVTVADLPLSCPMVGTPLWDAHPQVYLAIEATGRATCSYCGAEYILTDANTHAAD